MRSSADGPRRVPLLVALSGVSLCLQGCLDAIPGAQDLIVQMYCEQSVQQAVMKIQEFYEDLLGTECTDVAKSDKDLGDNETVELETGCLGDGALNFMKTKKNATSTLSASCEDVVTARLKQAHEEGGKVLTHVTGAVDDFIKDNAETFDEIKTLFEKLVEDAKAKTLQMLKLLKKKLEGKTEEGKTEEGTPEEGKAEEKFEVGAGRLPGLRSRGAPWAAPAGFLGLVALSGLALARSRRPRSAASAEDVEAFLEEPPTSAA